MAKNTIAVVGATGHVGHAVTEELLKKGHKVRAIGHNNERMQQLKSKGAEPCVGDVTDVNFLAKTFKGCQAVLSMIPPGYNADDMEVFRDRAAEANAQAIAKAKITHIVHLSSLGAGERSGTGPIKELHLQEERLNSLPNLNILHFRAGFFMENLLGFIPNAKATGRIASSLESDCPLYMVSTSDIGKKIAEFLDSSKFTGSSVFEFVGPRTATMQEATQVIGKAIGKPNLKYTQLSYEEAEEEMIHSGMKHQVAKLMVEMQKACNEKRVAPTQKLTAEHKGKTTLEEFCKNNLAQASRPVRKAA